MIGDKVAARASQDTGFEVGTLDKRNFYSGNL